MRIHSKYFCVNSTCADSFSRYFVGTCISKKLESYYTIRISNSFLMSLNKA